MLGQSFPEGISGQSGQRALQGWVDKGLVEVDSSDHLSLPTVPTRPWTALQ